LYISECIEGTVRLMRSEVAEPLNIGSEELVTIGGLADLIIEIAGKKIEKRYVYGPVGVRGRSSDNRRIRELLGWAPAGCLRDGLERTYAWIVAQAEAQ
jgi:nucleoside-diphosphate-sugar epimerase